jgi:hypothetical protein
MTRILTNRISLYSICAASVISFTSCASSRVGIKQATFEKLKAECWASEEFQPPTQSGQKFSPSNAYSLARACRLVWEEDKGAIAAVADQWGLDHLFVDLRATHSQYLLLGNKDFTILAFRATQSKVRDIGTVLKFGRYETKEEYEDGIYGGQPPGAAGFREGVADCFSGGLVQDIKLFRRATGASDKPLFITGHSLGGALAVLTRAKLAKSGMHSDSLYVYGCPVTVSPCGTKAQAYRDDFRSTNFFLRFPGDNVPRLRWYNETYTPPGQSFEVHPDGRMTDYSEYRTLNGVTSIGWCVPWLANWISNHNLERSYLPALHATTE